MVINPNILTIHPIIYLLLVIPIVGIWTFAKWNKNEKYEKLEDFFMAVLDTLPALLLFPLNVVTVNLEIFIVFVTLANLVIHRVNTFVGAVIYAIGYLIIGLNIMQYNFQFVLFLIALLVFVAAIIWEFTLKKIDMKVKFAGAAYAIFALVPLLYCFLLSKNFGFLSLVIGDVLLGVQYLMQVNNKSTKTVNYISNLFFYIGVWLTPLSLIVM